MKTKDKPAKSTATYFIRKVFSLLLLLLPLLLLLFEVFDCCSENGSIGKIAPDLGVGSATNLLLFFKFNPCGVQLIDGSYIYKLKRIKQKQN
jgi:hypothetical protein